jgi:D-alanine-D-alanine ligase
MNAQTPSKVQKKPSVAVLFGGRSAEHEISVITALQAIQAMDPYRYTIIPVYIAQNGRWFTGERLMDRFFYQTFDATSPQLEEVALLPHPTRQGLVCLEKGRFTQKCIPIDICFLAFHGQQGEDGCIQGLLELADIPYTGCGVVSSAMAMHKHYCKVLLHSLGIPVLPGICVRKREAQKQFSEVCQHIIEKPGLGSFPLFVKPCNLGSSIGIALAKDIQMLHGALAYAFQYDDEVLVEPYVEERTEMNISVLEGDPPIASVIEIPLSQSGSMALSYADKYLRKGSKTKQETTDSSSSQGMANLSRIINPKTVSEALKKRITQYAIEAFTFLECAGVSRFDFIFDNRTEQLYFNELNPNPGSLAYYLWEHSTPTLLYTELLERLLKGAEQRKVRTSTLQRNLRFKALGRWLM